MSVCIGQPPLPEHKAPKEAKKSPSADKGFFFFKIWQFYLVLSSICSLTCKVRETLVYGFNYSGCLDMHSHVKDLGLNVLGHMADLFG